jgi:hypothetical protein
MARAVRFYEALGFALYHGGASASFSSLHAGTGFLNLIGQPDGRSWSWWGRVIKIRSSVCHSPGGRQALVRGGTPWSR